MFKLSSSQGAHLFNCILECADGPLLASCMEDISVPMQCRPAEISQVSGHSAVAVAGGPFELGRIKLLVQPSAELASPVQVASALWRQQGLRSIASEQPKNCAILLQIQHNDRIRSKHPRLPEQPIRPHFAAITDHCTPITASFAWCWLCVPTQLQCLRIRYKALATQGTWELMLPASMLASPRIDMSLE